MKKKACIRIEGKVQGVFFRASTKEKAAELNIYGFVENLNDGAVYIEAVGEEKALQQFIDWCHKGPVNAAVANVNIDYREAGEMDKSFKIRY